MATPCDEDEDEEESLRQSQWLITLKTIPIIRSVTLLISATMINILTAPFYVCWMIPHVMSLPSQLHKMIKSGKVELLKALKSPLSSLFKAILYIVFPLIIYCFNWTAPL